MTQVVDETTEKHEQEMSPQSILTEQWRWYGTIKALL
jgi:hypothetical protein